MACGSRESGTTCSAPTNAATSSGTLIQNTDDHEKLRISAPPTIGPSGDAGAAGRGPCGDRLGTFAGIAEHVDEDRQCGRHDQRAADAHDAAAGDQRGRRAGGGGDDRAGEERGQAGEERVSATEAVTEASGGEEQTGEHDGVGGDDPLQLGRAGAEVADEPGHGDVDDGVVDGGDEQGEDEHAEDAPTVGDGWCGCRRGTG